LQFTLSLVLSEILGGQLAVNLPHHCQYATKPPIKFSNGYLADIFNQLTLKHSLKLSLGLATTILLGWENAAVFALPPQQQVIESFPISQTESTMTPLFVNPTAGNDSTGNGSDRAPFKTITQALKVAKENTVIYLAPGTYSQQNGEKFPLELKAGVTVQGDPPSKGRAVIIRGGGSFLSPTFARQNATILAVNKSGIAGVTVTNPNIRGYGIWIESSNAVIADNTLIGNSHDGISVAGNSAPLIRSNYFANNGANGMTIYGSSRPEVRENVFERTGFAINIGHNATPLIVGNRISQNTDGILVQGKARPILRGNTIESNSRDGLVALTETLPDLGSAQDPAGNIFRNNGRYEINASTAQQVIPVYGNQLATRRLVGRISLDGNLIQVNAPRSSSPAAFSDGTSVKIPVPTPAARPRRTRRNTRRRTTPRRRRVSRPVRRPSATTRKPSQASTPGVTLQVPPPQRAGLPQGGIQAGVLPTANPPFSQVNTNSVPPNNQVVSALSLRYLVLVEVRTLDEQTRLLSLVPEASRTVSDGKVVMEVGPFSDRSQADRMLQQINSNGLLGTIEQVN
jgi:parallel beta-helix repeat protein